MTTEPTEVNPTASSPKLVYIVTWQPTCQECDLSVHRTATGAEAALLGHLAVAWAEAIAAGADLPEMPGDWQEAISALVSWRDLTDWGIDLAVLQD
jgi:hypothetical protein